MRPTETPLFLSLLAHKESGRAGNAVTARAIELVGVEGALLEGHVGVEPGDLAGQRRFDEHESGDGVSSGDHEGDETTHRPSAEHRSRDSRESSGRFRRVVLHRGPAQVGNRSLEVGDDNVPTGEGGPPGREIGGAASDPVQTHEAPPDAGLSCRRRDGGDGHGPVSRAWPNDRYREASTQSTSAHGVLEVIIGIGKALVRVRHHFDHPSVVLIGARHEVLDLLSAAVQHDAATGQLLAGGISLEIHGEPADHHGQDQEPGAKEHRPAQIHRGGKGGGDMGVRTRVGKAPNLPPSGQVPHHRRPVDEEGDDPPPAGEEGPVLHAPEEGDPAPPADLGVDPVPGAPEKLPGLVPEGHLCGRRGSAVVTLILPGRTSRIGRAVEAGLPGQPSVVPAS